MFIGRNGGLFQVICEIYVLGSEIGDGWYKYCWEW
jgi:hypothetical protein